MGASYFVIAPAACVAIAACAALFGDIFGRAKTRGVNTFVVVLGLSAAAAFLLPGLGARVDVFGGAWGSDPISEYCALILLGAGLLYVAASWGRRFVAGNETDYFSLVALAIFGAMIVAGARDLVVLYLGIELVALPLYVLVAFARRDELGIEGALKYFMQGMVASLVMLYGMSFLFGVTQTTRLADIAAQAPTFAAGRSSLFVLSIILVSVGFLFKLAAAPFHYWAPDVYEGAPTVVTSVIAFVPKVAGLVALVRIFDMTLAPAKGHWQLLFALVAVVSMFVGNLVALVQIDIKRMLAYSSIAHAGYMLVGVAVGTPRAVAAVLFYVLAYGVASVGAFFVLIASGTHTLDDIKGLARRSPLLAVSMVVFLLSLIGVPPLIGFFGKLVLFGAAVEAGLAWLAVVGVVNSVVSVGYYFLIVRAMIFAPDDGAAVELRSDPSAVGAVLACAALAVALGVAFGPIVSFISRGLA